jgi:uncharacterized protein YbjT (DUF2867 family)
LIFDWGRLTFVAYGNLINSFRSLSQPEISERISSKCRGQKPYLALNSSGAKSTQIGNKGKSYSGGYGNISIEIHNDKTHMKENSKIVVIGGSGLIGTKLVKNLRQRGHEVVPASPSTGVNTLTGEGLAEALKGAQVVVDVSNAPSWEDKAVLEFFETSCRNLFPGEAAAGVKHHVALSVVGTERLLSSGYFRAKMAQETKIRSSKIPYTIVRATQFFEFVGSIAKLATEGATVRVPAVLMQPIVSDDVAAALADVACSEPINGTVEIAGPEQIRQDELIRQFLSATGDARNVIADAHARYYGIEVDDRSLVPGPKPRLGSTRFADWLSQHRKELKKAA